MARPRASPWAIACGPFRAGCYQRVIDGLTETAQSNTSVPSFVSGEGAAPNEDGRSFNTVIPREGAGSRAMPGKVGDAQRFEHSQDETRGDAVVLLAYRSAARFTQCAASTHMTVAYSFDRRKEGGPC